MAIYTACLASGPFVGGVSGSYIAGTLGYKYLFWISTALAASTFVLIFFLVPETLFDRQRELRTDLGSTSLDDKFHDKPKVSTNDYHIQSRSGEAFTYTKSLGFGPYRGNWARNFIAPWLTLAFPATYVFLRSSQSHFSLMHQTRTNLLPHRF